MEGFGAITDTQSLEDSVVHALERLQDMPQDARTQSLRTKAMHYRDILASWELMPPSADEQSETVSRVLQLLGKVMAYVNGDDMAPTSSDAPPVSMPSSARGSRPSPSSSAPRSSQPRLERSLGGDRSAPERGQRRPLPRRQRHSKRKVSTGRIEVQFASGDGEVATAEILFPFQRSWESLRRVVGGAVKVLHRHPASGQHVLVRLLDRAELPAHVQPTTELIYVLRGGVRLSEESLFAGAVIRTTAGAHCPPLRSIGETELLFVGTTRPELELD